jgi:hypothetical protein
MDYISIKDLLNEEYAEMPSPLNFLAQNTSENLDSPQVFFSGLYDKQATEKDFDECYDKYESYFSELEKEADHTYNKAFNLKDGQKEIENSMHEPSVKDESKSSALTKNENSNRTPLTTQIDQSSIMSQVSEEGDSQKEEINVKKFSSCLSSVDDNLNSFEDSYPNYKTSEENFDENEVVFLVRKINKTTKTSTLITKHRKKITMCPHKTQEYYAKGMCKNCYHNKGKRSKRATKCDHHDRDHYAKGLCKNCYLHFFHIKKKERQAKETNQVPAPTTY